MMLREKKDIRPVLFKFGVAVALSLGGIIYTFLRTRNIKPSGSPPSLPSSGDHLAGISDGKGHHRNDNHVSQRTASCSNSASVGSEKYEESSLPKSSLDCDLSPSSRSNGDRDSYLLPEFNELVKDFSIAASKASFSLRKDMETLDSDGETPRGCKCATSSGNEQEITSLRNMVNILRERERNIEIQLLEYYGLKEQETAAMELQNRLKINNMEAKLFSLKIESLEGDKRRLEEQVADHAKVVAELEAAKAKLKLLKRKLRYESEHNREQILALQERVMKLQEHEKKAIVADPDIQVKLQKLKELEEQADELRKSNNSLRTENSELSQKLEYVQLIATSVLDAEETTGLKEEIHRLRQENEDLRKDIEQLQADRCSDAEELVYMRWLNACLRYELRNYQSVPGKTNARDLSKTLSPKSEEKAKQLIVEYATKEGQGEKGLNGIEFDSDQWSSSQASLDLDDSPIELSSANKTHSSSKSKVFGKLLRLFRGKDNHHHSRSSSSETAACVVDMVGRYSVDSPGSTPGVDAGDDGINSRSRSSSRGSRYSLDIKGTSEDGSLCILRHIDSIAENSTDSTQLKQFNQDPENFQKSELMKYAEVLKDSQKNSFCQRSLSFGSY